MSPDDTRRNVAASRVQHLGLADLLAFAFFGLCCAALLLLGCMALTLAAP